MGQLKHKGKALDFVAPVGETILKGELYRNNKWNHIAMTTVLPTDPELGYAGEADNQSIWYVQFPSGLVSNRGDTVWWDATEGFKNGPTDLVASGTGGALAAAAKVEDPTDANGITGVRVLNIS